ncbi:malto-oligosyltrehalose trehalohydrolase [Desertibaculum subflavum]|uniref:malto-oligosyltrehalose trehalohydrolase n=1 Tax=Desertibaculum subflavum TaxID=2268458 RepID=UPI0034D1E934
MRRAHAMPFGAILDAGRGTSFRLWAPAARQVELCLRTADGAALPPAPMPRAADGWYSAESAAAAAGARYSFRIDGEMEIPDPASRFQPDGVHGPSEVIDPGAFDWADHEWNGRPWHETVLYELHLGSFTPEGTCKAAIERLDHLRDLGVTAIELMPLAEFPGARNWGYDGTLPFAPTRAYGRPEDLKQLVQAAHQRGLMVFLDVVYNHFGPEGNYLHRYAPDFFTDRHQTPWGAAINFDAPGSPTVRDFFVHNALYWLEEFHIDGLRLDAVHAIRDDSRPDILEELAARVATDLPGRQVHLVLENDDNAARYLARDAAGRPTRYAAQWNDDIHHVLHVLATGETTGYYGDYGSEPHRRLGRALAEGFVYQGEPSPHRGGAARGEPSAGLPPTAFVAFLQNHDQVGNRAMGERISALADAPALRAAMSVVLLSPQIPMLFMGEEWHAPQPFPFFCDFGSELADAVREGRRREFARFPEFADPVAQARIPDPLLEATFAAAKLDWSVLGREPHRTWLEFVRSLLAIRHREIVPRLADIGAGSGSCTMHGDSAVEICWRLGDGSTLQAVLALSAQSSAGVKIPRRGRPLFVTEPDASTRAQFDDLPPWFAGWFLAAPGDAG